MSNVICLLENNATDEEVQAYIDAFHPDQPGLHSNRWPKRYSLTSVSRVAVMCPTGPKFASCPSDGSEVESTTFVVRITSHLGCRFIGMGPSLEYAVVQAVLDKAEHGRHCVAMNCPIHRDNHI